MPFTVRSQNSSIREQKGVSSTISKLAVTFTIPVARDNQISGSASQTVGDREITDHPTRQRATTTYSNIHIIDDGVT
jgi:hypothetical protein